MSSATANHDTDAASAQADVAEPFHPDPEVEFVEAPAYTMDHLSAVMRPVMLTMVLARFVAVQRSAQLGEETGRGAEEKERQKLRAAGLRLA
jgi:hypothetical protein